VSFAVHDGTVHALLGHNGAGKTTLMRALAGQIPLTSGAIRTTARPAVLFVGSRYPADLHVSTIIDHRLRQLDRPDMRGVFDAVGVTAFADRKGGTLSTGEAQRLSIALALAAEPQLIALDEPTSGLDPQGVEQLRRLIGQLRDTGTTILMCSHDLAELELVCDEVTCLRGGKLTATGTVAQVAQGLAGTGHILRTDDDAHAAAVLSAHNINTEGTARGLLVDASTDITQAVDLLRGVVTVSEISVARRLFNRIYDAYGSAPTATLRTRLQRTRTGAVADSSPDDTPARGAHR
jgi:ABC-type multidrug transport system ATPase subunit